MKKIVTALTIFAFFPAFIIAQEQKVLPAQASTESTSSAEISFEKDVHDFGTIEHGGNGTYEFKFKNTGKEPLIVTDAKGSCGCTVPTFPKNIPIKPGETQTIKVTYDTKRPGVFNKTVTVSSNAKTPQKIITIKGKVEAAPTDEAFPVGEKKNNSAIPFEK